MDIEKQINGFGARLNNVEVDLGKTKVKIEHTEEDIGEIRTDVRRLFEGQNTIRSTLSKGLGALAVLYVVLQVVVKIVEVPGVPAPGETEGMHEKAVSQGR